MGFAHKLRVFAWGEPPDSKEERKLLLKVDCFVLSFTCLMYWSNYLNRTNFTSAFVTGMSEDLHFQQNQFNIVNTVFTVGYIIGQIPNNLMLQIVPPHIWLPSMCFLWGVLSMTIAAAKTPQHVMAIRFFQAIMESSTFSGSHYILGSWYKDTELGKRTGIFASSAQLGSLFSGVMQGAIFTNLEGYQGLRSWQWLFLLDGIIATPIALYGFLAFPDTPKRSTHAFFLTAEERELAVSRLPKKPVETKMDWDLIRRVLGRWHWYAFSALFGWGSMLESVGINGLFPLWLKSEGYSPTERNYWPLSLYAIAITSTILCANLSDYYKMRWPVGPFMSVVLIVVAIILLIWTVPFGLKFFAFALSGIGYSGQAAFFAWANVVCADDDQERAVVLASMNLWSNVINAWWSIVLYPVTTAPRFQRGFIAMICVAFLTTGLTLLTRHLDIREQRDKERSRDATSDSSEAATTPEKVVEEHLVDARRQEAEVDDGTS